MTIRHDYLLLALAIVLSVTNGLGASLTIRRNLSAKRDTATPDNDKADISLYRTNIYGRLAIAQVILVTLAIVFTAIGFSHSFIEWIQLLSTRFL